MERMGRSNEDKISAGIVTISPGKDEDSSRCAGAHVHKIEATSSNFFSLSRGNSFKVFT